MTGPSVPQSIESREAKQQQQNLKPNNNKNKNKKTNQTKPTNQPTNQKTWLSLSLLEAGRVAQSLPQA